MTSLPVQFPLNFVVYFLSSYLVIVKTDSGRNIERYNVETEVVDLIKSGDDFPQDVSVDADNGVVYWVNVIGGSTFKVMSTSYAGVTIDLNITYADGIEIAQDELYLYVLVVSNETIYKYRKNTWEQIGSIVVPSGTSGIEVAFGEYQSWSRVSIKSIILSDSRK
jgi:sugar lactone lactonase YvrE